MCFPDERIGVVKLSRIGDESGNCFYFVFCVWGVLCGGYLRCYSGSFRCRAPFVRSVLGRGIVQLYGWEQYARLLFLLWFLPPNAELGFFWRIVFSGGNPRTQGSGAK